MGNTEYLRDRGYAYGDVVDGYYGNPDYADRGRGYGAYGERQRDSYGVGYYGDRDRYGNYADRGDATNRRYGGYGQGWGAGNYVNYTGAGVERPGPDQRSRDWNQIQGWGPGNSVTYNPVGNQAYRTSGWDRDPDRDRDYYQSQSAETRYLPGGVRVTERGAAPDWRVGPHAGRGPINYRRSDERIMEDICDRLTEHGQLDASDINVDVKEGEATLKGSVDSRRAKRLAEDVADSVPGVKDVHNELKVQDRETTVVETRSVETH